MGQGSPIPVMLIRCAQTPSQLRHGIEGMRTAYPFNLYRGICLLTVPGERARHEVLAETGKPSKLVVPISETCFVEVEQATNPASVQSEVRGARRGAGAPRWA